MKAMERPLSAGTIGVAAFDGCRCIDERRAVYDRRRAKRLGFGTTGGRLMAGVAQ